VRLGVPLPGNVHDENGNMLLSKGQILNTQSQLDTLLERGMYVETSLFEAQFRALTSNQPPVIEKKFDPFLARNTQKISLNRLLRGVLDGSTNVAQIIEFADHVQHFAGIDAEAAIAACLLDRQEESYAVSHSLSTATLCALLVRRIDWLPARQNSTICAALTMNLGMLEIQQRLSRQATPLTPTQLAQVQAHPESSLAALKNLGIDDPVWLEAVRQHHENPAGTGYPQHLAEPSEEGQLLRLSDIFFARACVRADRRPLPPAQIVRTLFVEEGKGACASLVAALVKMIGIYPPGCFVKLANGEVGVVFRNGESPGTPIVAAVASVSGMPTMQPVRRETHHETFAISGAVAPDKVTVGYDLGKLWITNARS
jgi:HD-GYP domain-containing protein (c-di-GMP phosphodiesterase class II)